MFACHVFHILLCTCIYVCSVQLNQSGLFILNTFISGYFIHITILPISYLCKLRFLFYITRRNKISIAKLKPVAILFIFHHKTAEIRISCPRFASAVRDLYLLHWLFFALLQLSRVMRKPDFCLGYAKTKALISCAVTAQLISAFVFAMSSS